MSASIYLLPLGTTPSPQAEQGVAVRLAGGMVYAHRFLAVLREDGKVTQNWRFTPDTAQHVFDELPDGVVVDAKEQWRNLARVHPLLELGQRTVRLDQPQVVGILNVTPDSFSDGGEFLDDTEAGRAHAAAMLEAGAAMIDIGGESTRPGAAATWEGDEIKRVIPAVEYCAAMGAAISVDTRRPATMEAALAAGAHVVNDVSALQYDPRSRDFVAQAGCPVILMHAPGTGDDPHADGGYADVVLDVFETLRERRDAAVVAGVAQDRIVLDPGIGFGKTLAQNLALMNALPLFHALGCPLMVGASRKRMIGALSNEAGAGERLGGSLALALAAMNAGVQMLRVHDVAETVQARNVWRGLRDAALTDFARLPGA